MLPAWLRNEDMKSSCQKEEPDNKKGYVFFSDPDVIVKRAESSAIAAQIRRDFEAQRHVSEKQSANLPTSEFGSKSLENFLSFYPVQPYPFTFISAVKQKLALGSHSDIGTKPSGLNTQLRNNLTSSTLETNYKQNPYQAAQKMDLFRPLKVPDLKISPKTLDFSSRENSVSRELSSAKSEIAAKELAHDRSDKMIKIGERVQRKLDFSSSDGPSAITCENIEPLKIPNVSIASNLSKKKEHARDSSREKENRSKRIKKDDSLCVKKDEPVQDQMKRSRSPRHVSRRDAVENISGVIATKSKNDRLPFHTTKNNDSLLMKSKMKNFVTSTVKKDSEKKQRSFNTQSMELTRDLSLESKGRIYSNKALDSVLWKPDKVTTRETSGNVAVLSNNIENKFKDISHLRQVEDLKYKCDSDNRQLKQDKPNITHKEQAKRASDKSKITNNKIEESIHSANSEPSEDIECMSETNSSKNRASIYPVSSMQESKSEDVETTMESKQNVNSIRSSKTSYIEHSAAQSTSGNKDEESYSQSITTGQMTANDDSNNVDINILPDELFDARRISFRDTSYSQQEEFHNLSTPDKMDFISRAKQRRYLQTSDSEADARCSKYKSTAKSEKEQEKTQLRHPEALRMTLQAECGFLESLNEAYRNAKEVEKCLHNIKREQKQKNPQMESEKDEEAQVGESRVVAAVDNDAEKTAWKSSDYMKKDVADIRKSHVCDEALFSKEHYISNQASVDELGDNFKVKVVKVVAEVQTQTVNDMATQTDAYVDQCSAQNKSEIHENIYERSSLGENEIYQLLLNSTGEREDQYQIEEISLPSRITMSEISLHETTSSIKTETGNEISISTRDVTCSFKNKAFKKLIHLDISRQIKDEKQRYDKLEMLFKTREKTLNDKTKKLVKLEEQKRALRDTGQDSRISSVKKKQRALLLKLKEEQDEMNRLKELHEIASQERKLMLQKQKDMFNPQLSTKNILTKLKRSANREDSQSPRRLSGPMKGYDIRSNSSISSLIDSDKSQHDRSQADARLQASESDAHLSRPDFGKSDRFENLAEESNTSATRFDDLVESNESHEESPTKPQRSDMSTYELKSRKYEEKMPKADILRQKQNQLDLESKRIRGHSMKMKRLMENQKPIDGSQSQSRPELDVLSADHMKSESDTLVEELSKRSRTLQIVDPSIQTVTSSKELITVTASNESIEEDINSTVQDVTSKTTKSQISEDISYANTVSKNSKKIDKSITSDRDHAGKKSQHGVELKANSKRKNSKHPKTKSNSYALEKLVKHYDKRTRTDNESLQLDNNNESSILDELDLNENQNALQTLVRHSRDVKDKNLRPSKITNDYESKENISNQASNRRSESNERLPRNERAAQNVSTSRFSAFAISHQSSEESEKNLSVVVRSQNKDFKASKKLEQILSAREAALTSRKNTVEEWMAWHTRLRAEEERVTRMEQATLKIAAATSNVLSQQDTTVSSDMSDVEGRIEMLTEKLAERRIEMSRLKREARRQTKQKLRAMEANLLNQIKRYDTTIHEMRKKLDSKKAIKDSDKLAIEPKSLADFKVPEIPLKRIQDIYKNSDLLRSRSESDLLLTRIQQKDLLKIITPTAYYDTQERNNLQKSVRSTDTRSTNASELKSSIDRSDHSAQFEECTSTEARNKFQTVPTTSSSDARTERRTITALDTDEKLRDESLAEWRQSTEDIRTIASTVKSELEARTVSDARSTEDYGGTVNTESANDGSIRTTLDQSQPRTLATRSEIPEELTDVDYTKSVLSKSVLTITPSDHDALTFSEKLDFLQLNNRNLNENISSLENGLKALSEMMSRFSDKPTKKTNHADNDERSTSHDISEIISRSVFSDRTVSVGNEDQKAELPKEKEIESFSVLTIDRRSKSSNDLSRDKHTSEKTNSEISALISDAAPGGLSGSIHEIDYEAKSKEIMNEIEKSILSEHSKVTRGDYNVSSVLENDMQNLHKGNEELLNDLISLELDIKSISEILSKVSESRKSLGLATSTASQIIDNSKVDASTPNDRNEMNLEKEQPVKNEIDVSHSPKLSERSIVMMSPHSPIIAGHRSKESGKSNSQCNVQSEITSRSSKTISEELLEAKASATDDGKIEKSSESKRNEDVPRTMLNDTAKPTTLTFDVEQNQSHVISVSADKDDWTTSDSFEVPQSEISIGEDREISEAENLKSRSGGISVASNNLSNVKNASHVEDTTNREAEVNLADIDVSVFIPKGESTNIDVRDVTFTNTTTESHARRGDDELDDILSIIARESNQEESIRDSKNQQLDNAISDSMDDLLSQVEAIVEHSDKSAVSHSLTGILCNNDIDVPIDKRPIIETLNNEAQSKVNVEDISGSNIANIGNYDKPIDKEGAALLQAVSEVDDKSAININLRVEIDNEMESLRETISEAQEIIITELDSNSIEDHALPELEIDAKVELAEDDESDSAKSDTNENDSRYILEKSRNVEVQEYLEPIFEQDSSDGEQLDNLVEVVESGLDTIEKPVASLRISTESKTVIDYEKVPARVQDKATDDTAEANTSQSTENDEVTTSVKPIADNLNKTFDIVKDPDYEDISEESLEVSEILDKNELPKGSVAKKPTSLLDKYQATPNTDEVLRILDEISQKSSPDSINNSQKDEKDALSAQSATEEISELIGVEVSAGDTSSPEIDKMKDNKVGEEFYKGESKDRFLEGAMLQERRSVEAMSAADLVEEKSNGVSSQLDDGLQDKSSQIIYELRERVSRLQEQDGSSESSEAGDTPRGVSEIEMDSPRDFNDSRLDIDILDDDLLSGTKTANQNVDVKTNFHSASIVATSEKDIEAMIYKLKASLKQPGLEVAELEAKLLRIEQLEIELEIKKLEAEEVSYYVREIPNKPPPPYTPPGDGRLSTSLGSPSSLTAVVPSNVEELMSFTERAITIIYNAKMADEDIMSLETPAEIHELTKEKNEIMKKDRRIYNNFLFDLCKEIVTEVYRAEYEKPGPSWTKPNVKTKPTMKIPKTVEELTEYVGKEVATLFGFKTKLQRENMVMRWSRKRRDRVDELLAREAQAEEDEWTKFHHDELAVKNGLTVAILDTLVMETVNVVKIAYGKKRRLMV